MSTTTDPELTRRATDLAAQLIETIPDGTPADVAAIAVLTTLRIVAAAEPAQVPRIAGVLQRIAHELATGQPLHNTH
jgi:hypothetical protein